jgi:hypothetical protein
MTFFLLSLTLIQCFRHVTVEFECEVFRILRHQDLKLSKTKESYQLEKQDHTAIQGMKKSDQSVLLISISTLFH